MKCSNCGRVIPDGAKFCKYCGVPVNDLSLEEDKANNTEKIRCSVCGALVNGNNRYCTNCGLLLIRKDFSSNNSAKTKQKKRKRRSAGRKIAIAFVVLTLMLVAFIAAILLFYFQKHQTYEKEMQTNTISETAEIEETDIPNNEDVSLEIESESVENIEDTTQSDEFIKEIETEANDDVTEGGIHSYGYFIDDCTWSEAFYMAQESGGYLVRINSRDEYEYILNDIISCGYENIQFFLGARRNVDSKEYYWVNENNDLYGIQLNETKNWTASEWMQGEPSFQDTDIEETCVNIHYNSEENRWVWNDVPEDILSEVPYYSGRIGYIVEYERNPQ